MSLTLKQTWDLGHFSNQMVKILKLGGRLYLEHFLNEIIVLLKEESEHIDGDKKELQSTYSRIEQIDGELVGFDKIVKRLRMLGISTKIESSRLSLEDAGFFVLAENVDRLSNIITQKIDLIKKQSNVLLTELRSTIRELEVLEIKQNDESNNVLAKTTKSLNAFKEKSNEFSEKTKKISELFGEVSANIGDIVSSIQFHDITRQQMEHSSEALNDICEKLQLKSNDVQTDELFWGHTFDVFELQSVQLSNTLDEFENAVNTIISSLNNVENNISSMYSFSFGQIEEEKKQYNNYLKKFGDELLLISEGLLKDIEIGTQFSNSIKSIVKIVDELSTYVNEIEEVGSEIEIIALNARVKAAHFGTNGSALGVLAESIQRLSLEAKQQTFTTSDLLGNITQSSKKLRFDIEKGNNTEKNILAATCEIEKFVNIMITSETELMDHIQSVKNNVSVFKGRIEKTKSEITIQEDAKRVIGYAVKEIKDIAENIMENYHLESDRGKNTAELLAKYTMHSERKVHKDFTKNEKKYHSFAKDGETINQDENSLGDNVELF